MRPGHFTKPPPGEHSIAMLDGQIRARFAVRESRMNNNRSLSALLALAWYSASAQIISNWTHRSVAGSSSIVGESSAAVAMDGNYMFVADNEHEKLRLYQRFPAGGCPNPVYTLDVAASLNLPDNGDEVDLEAMAMKNVNGTNRIYWLGSHSNGEDGDVHPNRCRLFATTVKGNGTGSPPYSLAYVGRYDHLKADLCAWDRGNLHGLGSNYFGLAASTNKGISATNLNGFNMEGMCFAPDGITAYLGFRTPLVRGAGPTTNLAQRTHALVVPLLNIGELVTNNPVRGPGRARFGTPFTLDLGKRGIRSMDTGHPGNYLITAGPTGDASNPPVAPGNFRLFSWTGNPGHAPIERMTTFPGGYAPEGAILPLEPMSSDMVVQFVSDDDTVACWRSFTARLGEANQPVLRMLAPSNNISRLNLQLPPGQVVTIECSTNSIHWNVLCTITNQHQSTTVSDAAATNGVRFYRAKL